MIYVVFWHAEDYPDHVCHCEILSTNGESLSHRTPHVESHFIPYGPSGILTIFKLPIKFEQMAKRRKELGITDYPRSKERARHPIDFPYRVYTKKVMSCSHTVAYMLGLNEFWYYKPDDIMEYLYSYSTPICVRLRVVKWL